MNFPISSLVKRAELFELFFEEAGEALAGIFLPEGQVHCVNRAFVELTGFNKEEIEGEPVSVIASSVNLGARERAFDLQVLQNPGFYNDIVLPTRDGQIRYVSAKIRHTTVDGKTFAVAVISDDTERQLLVRDLFTKHQSLEGAFQDLEKVHSELKATQEQMFQVSKLVALGELAAGMSHELNQPLTGVSGFAQEIQDVLKSSQKPSKKQVYSLAQEIIDNASKMSVLLSHLRDFARKEKSESLKEETQNPEPVDLSQAFRSVKVLLKRQLEQKNIDLEFRCANENLRALARQHPVEQILINLITNSRDAINEKRKLSSAIFQGKILVECKKQGSWIEMRIIDNGPGVPEKIRTKIFDPFFSTKDQGKGMGLGLSISFGIAHKFGGELSLESTSASGSTFLLKLPLVENQEKGSRAA